MKIEMDEWDLDLGALKDEVNQEFRGRMVDFVLVEDVRA